MKGYVFITGHGLVKFKSTDERDYGEGVFTFRGKIRLPKGVRTVGNTKWMKVKYWFTINQIYDTPTDAINEMIERHHGYTGYGNVLEGPHTFPMPPNYGTGETIGLPYRDLSDWMKERINQLYKQPEKL